MDKGTQFSKLEWDPPKYDVRWWNGDKTRLGKGFTFTKDDLELMYDTYVQQNNIELTS